MPASAISRLQWTMMFSSPLVSLVFCIDELWRHHPAQHFFPLALGAVAMLVIQRIRRVRTRPLDMRLTSWAMMVHLVLALTSFVLDSPFIAGLAVVLAAFAFDVTLWNMTGRRAHDYYTTALSCFLIPPPLGLDESLRQLLAGTATKLSQPWLDDLGVLNLVEGSVVVTAGKRFFVNDACSGVNSMLVAICAALILCAFQKRSWIHSALLILSTAGTAIATNILRIVTVIYGCVVMGQELDKGWQHELLGMISFALDLLLVLSADRGLQFVLNHPSGRPSLPAFTATPAHVSPGGGWAGACSLVIACVGMALIITPQFLLHSISANAAALDAAQSQQFEMPARLGEWERQGDKPVENALIGDLSVHNVVWLYRKGGLEAYLAMNFPFEGFHDTRLCYLGQGWRMEKQHDRPMTGETTSSVRALELFHPVEQSNASLWLVVFDQGGHVLPYPAQTLSSRFSDRILQRWEKPKEPPVTFTLQVLVPQSPLDAGATGQVEALLTQARSSVSQSLARTSPSLALAR